MPECIGKPRIRLVYFLLTHGLEFRAVELSPAFLVSGASTEGNVRFVKIHSEKGRDCTRVNPWPAKAIDVYQDGQKVETLMRRVAS